MRIQFLIESSPLWDITAEVGTVLVPPEVVERIREQATYARDHAARVPKLELVLTPTNDA